MTVGDFNNDGIPDLAFTTSASGVAILLGKGDGSFGPGKSYPAGQNPSTLVAGDFNRDGNLDLAMIDSPFGYGTSITILLGNGDGTFQSPANFATTFGVADMAAGDFNGDGILDLAVSTQGIDPASLSVFLGTGTGTFSPALSTSIQYGGGLAVADFNGDGHLDIAIGSQCNCNQFAVLLGTGTGTFQTTVMYTSGMAPQYVVAGDFNGDHKIDLATSNSQDGTVSILTGNGDGTFQGHRDYSVGSYPASVVAGDFNGDGTSDLATAGNAGTLSILESSATVAIWAEIVGFGTESVGQTSAPKPVILTNPGSTPLSLKGFYLTGPDSSDFKQASNCPMKLAIAAPCAVDVTFTPSASGERVGVLDIFDNAPSSQRIGLIGTGR
jgi:hypothetical protein